MNREGWKGTVVHQKTALLGGLDDIGNMRGVHTRVVAKKKQKSVILDSKKKEPYSLPGRPVLAKHSELSIIRNISVVSGSEPVCRRRGGGGGGAWGGGG